MATPKLWSVAQTCDSALNWFTVGKLSHVTACAIINIVIIVSIYFHVNVCVFEFPNSTGQFKCGTWTSVNRCVKLVIVVYVLFTYLPNRFFPYLCTNKCRYQLKWFFKMKVALCVFQVLLICVISSSSPRSCGQHNWGQGRAYSPSSYTHQRRAHPGGGPS